MVEYSFPCDSRALLTMLRGHRIVMVRRQILLSDYDEFPPTIRDEESDGPMELVFDDGTTLHFVPDTEQMSVKVAAGQMPAWGEYYKTIESTANSFWAQRTCSPVSEVDVLVSGYAAPDNRSEFGVELRFEGGLRIVVEYVSDEAHADALRVSGDEPAGSYRRVRVT